MTVQADNLVLHADAAGAEQAATWQEYLSSTEQLTDT
jgi:hypothetical protein